MEEEMYVSLEAVNCFETWMDEVTSSIIKEPEKFGNRLLELAEEYDVEDLDELSYLLKQYWSQLEEYIPTRARLLVELSLKF